MSTSPDFDGQDIAVPDDAAERAQLLEGIASRMADMPLEKLRSLHLLTEELDRADLDNIPAKSGGITVKQHDDYYTFMALKAACWGAMEELGNRHGVFDLAQDNNVRTLEILLLLNIQNIPGRNNNDLIDGSRKAIEAKTLNFNLAKDFSTHRTLDMDKVDRYESANWLFGFFTETNMMALYAVDPVVLKTHFAKWREEIRGKGPRNNPKISGKMVAKYGTLLWGTEPSFRRWKKVTRSSRTAHPDVADRDDVQCLGFAMDASREKYLGLPLYHQVAMPMDMPHFERQKRKPNLDIQTAIATAVAGLQIPLFT